MEARRAHNPEVVGSSPASATRKEKVIPTGMAFFFYPACEASFDRPPGYETGERSSLGQIACTLPDGRCSAGDLRAAVGSCQGAPSVPNAPIITAEHKKRNTLDFD